MLGPMAIRLPPVGASNQETALLLVAVKVTGVPQVTESPWVTGAANGVTLMATGTRVLEQYDFTKLTTICPFPFWSPWVWITLLVELGFA
jgi:hypothetical protein